MIRTEINVEALMLDFDEIARKHVPEAVTRALNDTAFDTRGAWKDEALRVFDNPTSLTLNAILYKKATRLVPAAEVFVRDEALKGTPPSKYLFAQVEGGGRRPKRSENLLRRAGILGENEFWVPGRSAPLDAFGNLPGATVRTILSDVQASFDEKQRSTRESRGKRARRRKQRGKVYFYNRAKRGNLPRGIYERIDTAFGSAVRTVMHIVSKTQYRKQYDVYALARRVFDDRYPQNLDVWLRRLKVTL